MNVLVFTNMYPTAKMPFYGSFVRDEAEALRAAGVNVDVYFVNGRASKFNYLGMPGGFFSRLRRQQYDIIHVHHSFCGAVATLQRRVPVIWTFHEGEIVSTADVARTDASIKRLAYSSGLKRRVADRVTRLIVVADFLRGPLGRDDAITMACGIDTGQFAPMDSAAAKQALGIDPNRRYILFPSSPDRVEKRYELARDAVAMLHQRRGDAVADVELICLDRVPHEQVPMYINACELMLMTSAFEASPVTIREALSCNVPVLCTDIGDVRMVIDGIDGCAIIDADPGSIADALDRALSSARRIASRDRMQAHSLESTARRLIQIYEEVASG